MRVGLFPSLHGYRPAWLRGDVLAGLAVWAVLVPESLAYATIAGVPPVVGLYAAVPSLVLYAALGSSRHLVVAPMSATAALSAGVVGVFAAGGSEHYVAITTALALVTGAIALVAGLLRLGFLANFISEPVLKGFIVGLALTIVIGQLPKLFGVEKGEGDFFAQCWHLLTELGQTNGATLAVGATSLAAVLALKKLAPALPGSLIVVLLAIAAAALLDLDQHGVALVGELESGLPSLGLPGGVSLGEYGDLIGPACGVMLVGFAEGLGAAKTYAARAGYDIDPSRELVGLGAANLGAGAASGMVVNGSLSKTAVNGSAGAKSQVSTVVVALLTVLTLLFLTGLFTDLPEATLGAVVIAAVIELVDLPALRHLYRVWTSQLGSIYGRAARADFAAALAAMAGVLIFDTLPGLIIGIVVSMVLLLYRSSQPNVAVLGRSAADPVAWVDVRRHPHAVAVPGVLVLRPEAGLYFANAEHLRTRVLAEVAATVPPVDVVVLDAETVPFIDVTAAEALVRLEKDLHEAGIQLRVARDIGQVRDVLETSGADESLTAVYRTVSEAVDRPDHR